MAKRKAARDIAVDLAIRHDLPWSKAAAFSAALASDGEGNVVIVIIIVIVILIVVITIAMNVIL